MYYLVPYRFSLTPNQLPNSRLEELGAGGHIDIERQASYQVSLVRSQDKNEWLSPVINLRWDQSTKLQAILRPRRWLRRILQGEIVAFVLLMIALMSQKNYFLGTLVFGLVALNHTFIYLLMRRRFVEVHTWLTQQFS